MADQEPIGQKPPLNRPGSRGGPERGGFRQSQETDASVQKIADLLGVSPEQGKEILNVVQQIAGDQNKAQTQEIVRSQRRETTSYQIPKEGLAKTLGENLNLIPNETIRAALIPLLTKIGAFDPAMIGPGQINDWLGELQDQYVGAQDADPASAQQIKQMIDNLVRVAGTYTMGRDELGAIGFTLTGDEIKLLTSGLDGARNVLEFWVSAIERTSYSAEEDTNRDFFRKYSATIGWLPILANKYSHAVINGELVTDRKAIQGAVTKLIKEYRTRIHIHNMKWAIETTDWKIVQGMSNNMGSASLFEGFQLRNVSTAFNLFQRYFDRYRFVYGRVKDKDLTGVSLWRISPEIVAAIKDEVKEELERNAEFYGISSDDRTVIEAEAERAANIGLNLFSASMREGVHVARGLIDRPDMVEVKGYDRDLRKEAAYQSDPNELLANLYNPLQFGIEKWTRFGEPQKAILERILLFLGKGDMHTGRQEFNNLLAIVDYFSSGWRIKNVYDATEDRLKHFGVTINGVNREETSDERKARLNSLSTGLLLQWHNPFREDPNPQKKAEHVKEGKERLRAVAKYRPLELLKAYSVTIDHKGKEYTTGRAHDEFQRLLKSGRLKTSGGLPIDNYVRLEEVLGRYIYPIYEQIMQRGWDRIHGIDIGRAGDDPANPFDAEDQQLIIDTVSRINNRGGVKEEQRLEAEDLQSIYRELQDFLLREETIEDLATNSRQAYLYDRALYVDDAPLGKLEERVDKIIPISEKLFTIEGGRRDPYARMWGDTSSSAVVLEHGMNAMISRDPDSLLKELQEAMAAQTGYAGRPPYIKFLYSIAEGWLKLAKADPILSFVSLHDKVPFSSSEFEKLFGLAAPSMAPQELRQLYEKMQLILGKAETEPGGEDIDKRIKKGLGIEGYKIALTMLSKIALIMIIFMLKEQMEEMEKEE